MRLAEAESELRLRTDDRKGIGASRRIFDVVAAAAGLIALAPLMLLIAFAVYAESRGPIFFSQVRLGERGRHFRMHKFRKFHERGSTRSTAVTVQDDDRMTRVGRLLARSKLDEVPQLWNVLVGDMSFVGPRPESLAFADCFGERYRAVLDFRPGIFGPNQVLFRNECSFYRDGIDPEQFYRDVLFPMKADADLAYFPHRTMRRDLAWIVRGMFAVLGFRVRPDRGVNAAAVVEAGLQQRQQA